MTDEERKAWVKRERRLDYTDDLSWVSLIASIIAFMASCFAVYIKTFT